LAITFKIGLRIFLFNKISPRGTTREFKDFQ